MGIGIRDLQASLIMGGPYQRMDLPGWQHTTTFAGIRAGEGFQPVSTDILTPPSANMKFAKDDKVAVYGLSLAPNVESGVANVCRYSTPACRMGCVAHAGSGLYPSVARARIARTKYLNDYPILFIDRLFKEVDRAYAKHAGRLRVRLNAFSDLRWERIAPSLFTNFPAVKFYDYTKWPQRHRPVPANYHLTYSATNERRWEDYENLLYAGHNVAVVYADVKRGEPFGPTWRGHNVFDGDIGDDRWSDPRDVGTIIALRTKGHIMKHTRMPYDFKEVW